MLSHGIPHRLSPPVIIHGVAEMVREVCFATRDYAYLAAVTSAFLFVAHTSASSKKLRAKSSLWDNTLR